MLPEQQAPLVLTAITLRGIGSYLEGARLEVRPLTVLCGKNGSGKSTWLKVLDLLCRSLKAGRLPFGFDVTDWATDNIQLENAFYHLAAPEDHAWIANSDATLDYGPPGTIGLEFTAARDISLPDVKVHPDEFSGTARRFLWDGQVSAGARFRVRLAHPSYWDDGKATPELVHLVELQLDRSFVITMTGERDPFEKFEEGSSRPRRSRPYELACSGAFLPIPELDAAFKDVVPLVTVTDLTRLRCEPRTELFDHVESDNIESFKSEFRKMGAEVIEYFERRVRQVLEILLGGYFHIGAVREPYMHLSLMAAAPDDKTSVLRQRWVGCVGENAWLLERHYAKCDMWPVFLDEFLPKEVYGFDCLELFSDDVRSQDERLSRIWELAPSERKQKVARLISDLQQSRKAYQGTGTPEAPGDLDDFTYKWHDAHRSEVEESIAELLNSVRERRDLFAPCWLRNADDVEIMYYARQDVESLTRGDVLRLNRLLIEDALANNEFSDDPFNSPLNSTVDDFEQHIFAWMDWLTEVSMESPSEGMLAARNSQFQGLPGKLVSILTGRRVRFLLRPDSFGLDLRADHELSVARLGHPCFGVKLSGVVQPPRQFGSGFHQVFPIIVQLGLMRQGELIGIENPEVHLHPSLQLQLCEALMDHALAGRLVFVETHSDLVLRRVFRAILEEKLPQADVRIYFTALAHDLKASSDPANLSFRYSTITPIGVDERGRISNWPDGFLGDDVHECRRLLEIMYGGPESGIDDDE